MRIGIDSRPLSYQLTGIGIYLKNLLDAIQKQDHKNDYFLISNAPLKYDLKNPGWTKVEERFNHKFTSSLWMQMCVPLIASKLNIDLFWGTRHHLPVMLPQKVKTVLTIHDLVHLIYPATMFLPNLLLERMLMKKSLIRSDSIITLSQSTAIDIKKYYGMGFKKINTIKPGVPVLKNNFSDEMFEREKNIPERYFLFVGTLDPRKNFLNIFKAFERINPEIHDVHLIIIGGKGWKNNNFIKLIKSHPLKKYIHFTGYIFRDELQYYYKKALCLLFPSIYEGFGFPVLEAMSCGTPVITSNVSSMPEISGNAAITVNPGDVNALAESMMKLLNDKNLREKLITKGFERVLHFSWKRCAERTIKVFEKVLMDR